MYKDDYSTKAAFVQELSQVLSRFEVEDVSNLIYSQVNGRETVVIFFRSGGIKEVDVSMDSLAALTRDIMKAL